MRYIFIAFGLILCNLIISDSVTATNKHAEWFKQLERVQGRDPGGECVNRDRLLSQLISFGCNIRRNHRIDTGQNTLAFQISQAFTKSIVYCVSSLLHCIFLGIDNFISFSHLRKLQVPVKKLVY